MKHSLKVTKTDAGSEGILSFEGDMILNDVLQIKEVLLGAIEEIDTLHLEIDKVETVDISFLQLVCAAHRECSLTGKELFIHGTSEDTMKDLLSRAGYEKHLGCPIDTKYTCLWS